MYYFGVCTGKSPGGGKMCVLRVGPFSRRLTHFVAAALPKVPIRALKLGDRTSLAHNIRGLPSELKRTSNTSVAVPPVRCRGLVCGQGVFPPEDVFGQLWFEMEVA